jgi:raffinose/stachyose/melibiose transport system permease protein
MIIPFQSIMIPLVRVAGYLNLIDSIGGLVLFYWGFGLSMAIFLTQGFVKSIPRQIEEAAIVDGAGIVRLFVKIVLPLLQPIIVTILILDSLWVWNDFLLPLLFLSDVKVKTIPLAMSMLFDQYTKQWDLALPALVLSCVPIVAFFLAMQKRVVKGIVAGAVKG